MRKLLAAVAFLGFSLFWACHLGPEDKADTFDLEADPSWFRCDTLEVVLFDGDGHPLDTLFRDRLASPRQLQGLPGDKYPGGRGQVRIRGFQRDGGACVDQRRTFEEEGGVVKIDTLRDPDAPVRALSAFPELLSLVLNGDPAVLEARVLPAYADPACYWILDSSGVAGLDVDAVTPASRVRVSPRALGEGVLTLRSRKDGSREARVRVRVSSSAVAAVTLDHDSLLLYVKGPGEVLTAVITPFRADPRVLWHSGDTSVAAVDSAGRVTPVAAGRTFVFAVSGNGKKDSAAVTVRADAPVVTVEAPTGTQANAPILFRVSASHRIGHIVQIAWDLKGDGVWEDSLGGTWYGETVRFPDIQGIYPVEGSYTALFRVRDSEGNVTVAEAPVDVGNQPPAILSLSADTVISIRDSLVLSAAARDRDGGVAWVGWDFEGDGAFDDTLAIAARDSLVQFSRGHRFLDAGSYQAVFRAVDGEDRERTAAVRVRVELDAPVVDAGRDTTVVVGSDILLRARGSDGFGTLVKSEIRVGGGAFSPLPSLEATLKAPNAPDTLQLVVRVTDDDGLHGEDTVKVIVIMSANADLAALAVSAGALSPAFSPGTSAYQVRVPFADSVLRVTPTARDTSATIDVAGKVVPSGTASEAIPLAVGATPVVIGVSAPDGSLRVYSLSIVREPSADATLKSLAATNFTLRPTFAPNVLRYDDTVPYAVGNITLRPTVSAPGATLTVNGTPVPSGTPATSDLAFGQNLYRIVVTAMDSSSRTTYTLGIVRRAKVYIHRKLGTGGSVLADSLEAVPGVPRPVSAAVPTGYRFVRWSRMEGNSTLADSTVNPASVTVGSGLVRLQAQLELLRYTINATALGDCGTVSPAGVIGVDHGGSQTFSIVPGAGCRIQSVRVNGVNDTAALKGAYTFTNVTGNRTLEATFARLGKFTLTAAVALGAGTVAPAYIEADSGSTHTFVFKPAATYRFQELRDNNQVVAPSSGDTAYTLAAVRAAHHLTIRFRKRYTVTVQPSGCGTVSPGTSQVDSAGSINFSFQPLQGCKVDSLFVNGASLAPAGGHSFGNVTANQTLRVVFTRLYAIGTTWGTNGSNGAGGSVSPVNPVVDSLDNQTIAISPAAGYRRSGLVVNGGAVSPVPATYTFTRVTAPQTLAATFLKTFQVTGAVVQGAGSITPSTPQVVDTLGSQLVTFTPGANYRFLSLWVNGGQVSPNGGGNQHTVSGINRDTRVEVRFLRRYNIAVTAVGCGTVTPGGGAFDSNTVQTFSWATRPQGCSVDSVIVNGSPVAAANSHSFPALTRDHTLRVVFSQGYSIATTWGTSGSNGVGGSISPANPGVLAGGSVNLAINPAAGYRRLSLTVNGNAVTPVPETYAFTNVQANQTAHAAFLRTFTLGVSSVGCGSVAPAGGTVDTNTSHTFTFTPLQGCRVDSVFVNGNLQASAGSHTFAAVNRNNTLRVVFVRPFTIATSVAAHGAFGVGGSVNPAGLTVDSLDPASFTITPFPGYRRHSLVVNGSTFPAAETYRFASVTANQTLHAEFWRTFRVQTFSNLAGQVTSPLDATVDSNSTFTLQWRAAPTGYRLAGLKVNDVFIRPSGNLAHTLVIQEAAVCSVLYVRQYRVTGSGSPAAGGTVLPPDTWYDAGASAEVTVTPASGYYIAEIRDNGNVVPPDPSDPRDHRVVRLPGLSADHTITAVFAPRQIDAYTVFGLTNSPNYGLVDPEKAEVPIGRSHTLQFRPSQGFFVYSVLENGSRLRFQSGSSSYTIPSVDRERRIDVEFVPGDEFVTVEAFTPDDDDATVVAPTLCVKSRDMDGCTDGVEHGVTRGAPMGSEVVLVADPYMCPNPYGKCADTDLVPFRHWLDEGTQQTYRERELALPGFETNKRFRAVYLRSIRPPRDETDPPILLESGRAGAE